MEEVEAAFIGSSDHQVRSGKRLRGVIKAIGLRFTEAADIMGVTKHVLNHWMEGSNPIQPYPLYRLSRAKSVTFDYIFLGDWSNLPHWIAEALRAKSEGIAEAALAPDHKDPGGERRKSRRRGSSNGAHRRPDTMVASRIEAVRVAAWGEHLDIASHDLDLPIEILRGLERGEIEATADVLAVLTRVTRVPLAWFEKGSLDGVPLEVGVRIAYYRPEAIADLPRNGHEPGAALKVARVR